MAVILLVAIVAGVGGVLAGNWIMERRAASAESARLDENVGLGERTGLTGELDLQVSPVSLTVPSGKPATVTLTLTNKSPKAMVLNGRLAPLPASFESNQAPFKVKMIKDGLAVAHEGNVILYPPHTRKDFFRLRPGQSKQVTMDLIRTADNGEWNTSTPGVYTAEVWYETYLTGQYIGVHAWTGMSNHVVVKITVTR